MMEGGGGSLDKVKSPPLYEDGLLDTVKELKAWW